MKLKIIDLNVWQGGLLWENLAGFLQTEQPDILMMQEVMLAPEPHSESRFHTLESLQKLLPLPYSSFAPAFGLPEEDMVIGSAGHMEQGRHVLPGVVLDGNAILSKYPLSNETHWFYDVPFSARYTLEFMKYQHVPRNLQYATADINGKPLHLFNTQGIWDTHGLDNPRRLAMSQFIIKAMQGKSPAILTGDFNTNEGTRAIAAISEAFTNVFAPDKRRSSFNVKRKAPGTGYKDAVVDFMFTTSDVKILNHRTAEVDASDHLPLVVELEI